MAIVMTVRVGQNLPHAVPATCGHTRFFALCAISRIVIIAIIFAAEHKPFKSRMQNGIGTIVTSAGTVVSQKSYTEPRKSLGTWLREISTCYCLTFLPGPAWVLRSKICKDFFSALYRGEKKDPFPRSTSRLGARTRHAHAGSCQDERAGL